MKISHDGDRVSQPGPNGAYHRTADGCGDEYIQGLLADLASESPEHILPHNCSCNPAAMRAAHRRSTKWSTWPYRCPAWPAPNRRGRPRRLHHGVRAPESVPALRKALAARYYRPRDLDPAAIPCVAVEGAGLEEL